MDRKEIENEIRKIAEERPNLIKCSYVFENKTYFFTKKSILISVDEKNLMAGFGGMGSQFDPMLAIFNEDVAEIALGKHCYGYTLHIYDQKDNFFNVIVG